MRTFVQKPKPTQPNTSAKSTMPGRAHFEQSREVNSIFHLQRTIGNQPVQRLLHANAEGLGVGSDTTATVRFAHDFTQIPVHPKTPVKIQTKPTVDIPGDMYEQGADRIADQVMRMPGPQPIKPGVVRDGASASGTPTDHVARSLVESSLGHDFGRIPVYSAARAETPPGLVRQPEDLYRSDRQAPLPDGLCERLGAAVGADLSAVRVHDSTQAHALADRFGARALTVGRDIYFGRSEYAPGTHEGVRLLAHEIAHVVQEDAAPGGVSAKPGVTAAADRRERDADAFADAFARGASPPRVAAARQRGLVYRKLKVLGKDVSEKDTDLERYRKDYDSSDQRNLDRMVKSPYPFVFDSWVDFHYQIVAMREQEKAAAEVVGSVGFASLGAGGIAERNMDPRYWKLSKDGDYYEVIGKDYAAAIRAALADQSKNQLECLPQTDLMQLNALLRALGDYQFNGLLKRRLKALRVKLTIPLKVELQALPTLDDFSQLLPGDRVLFNAYEAFEDTAKMGYKVEFGQWGVENAVVVGFDKPTGDPLFTGGGVPGKKTRYEMQKFICETIYEMNPRLFSKPVPRERIEKVALRLDVSRLALLWRPE